MKLTSSLRREIAATISDDVLHEEKKELRLLLTHLIGLLKDFTLPQGDSLPSGVFVPTSVLCFQIGTETWELNLKEVLPETGGVVIDIPIWFTLKDAPFEFLTADLSEELLDTLRTSARDTSQKLTSYTVKRMAIIRAILRRLGSVHSTDRVFVLYPVHSSLIAGVLGLSEEQIAANRDIEEILNQNLDSSTDLS